MQMIIKKSVEHLDQNNMGYWEHLRFAASHGIRCIKAGVLLILHSIIPALFPRTGSILVNKLNKDFTEHNDYLTLKKRVEAFSEMIYTTEDLKNLTKDCR